MSFSVELVLALIILIPFIIINLFLWIGALFQKLLSSFLQKALKVEDKFKEPKNKLFKWINFIIWISIGIINVIYLDNPVSLGAIFIFLAFHSGTTLSKRFVFGIHDIKTMKFHLPDSKTTKIASSIVKVSIVLELLFVLSWALLYKYISVSIKSNLGIEVNILLLILWGSGLIYGIIFSLIQSSFSKQILLKNEIGIALLLSGEAVKEKIKSSGDGIKEKIKSSGEGVKEKIKSSGEGVKEKVKSSGEGVKEKIKKENVLKKLFKQ